MKIEQQATCRYEDKYHIFNVQVDIEALHDTILSDFLPSLTQISISIYTYIKWRIV